VSPAPDDVAALLAANRNWAESVRSTSPDFFPSLARQQTPRYFWIGCSDARVPANEIVGLRPGELFVHRNVANLVVAGDPNGLAALQYAVEVLQVHHVIICGHYGCGGVAAALRGDRIYGPIDRWLSHLREIEHRHHDELARLPTDTARWDRLCELNVREQVRNITSSEVIVRARERGQPLYVHGWIYGLGDGLLRDLNVTVAIGTRTP
jgi:carbonic anhydrase